jgi:hypothetical protein
MATIAPTTAYLVMRLFNWLLAIVLLRCLPKKTNASGNPEVPASMADSFATRYHDIGQFLSRDNRGDGR